MRLVSVLLALWAWTPGIIMSICLDSPQKGLVGRSCPLQTQGERSPTKAGQPAR